jgi:hypothetical protein
MSGKLSPFDFLNAINQTKENLFQDPQAEKDYLPFMVNRGLSYFYDTVMLANEMNFHRDTPKDWQFHFLLNSITKKKRFSKWAKAEKAGEDLQLVMLYYGYSQERAKEALRILSDEQLSIIKSKFEKGGKL